MKNLKILSCTCFKSFRNHDLVAIADALPWLEELDIGYSGNRFDSRGRRNPISAKYKVTDAGIEVISRKLRRLRKIDITGQIGCSELLSKIDITGQIGCSDRSLIALSSNCELLSEILCARCFLSEHGICFVLRHSRNLNSLRAGRFYFSPDDSFTFENSMSYAASLRDPHIACNNNDRLLGSISTAGIPVEKIILNDSGLSFHGLSTFLCACPSLKHLQLYSINFLTDNSVRDLCRYLPNLVSITLGFCSKLTTAIFFILAKECPLLSEIYLQEITLPVEDDFDMNLEKIYRITSLKLSHIGHLNDGLLRKIAFVSPNLQTLNVTGLSRLTTEGIGEILKCCSQIKHLIVDQTREMEIFLEQFKTRQIKIEHYLSNLF